MDFAQAPDDPAPVAVVFVEDRLLLSFVGADPMYVPSYSATTIEEESRVEVSVREEDGQQGFRTLAGHRRWACAQLNAPLGHRRLVGEDGRLLPVVRAEALLRLAGAWSLVGYEYLPSEGGSPRWASIYERGGRTASLTQGGPDLLHVDWQRDSFRPLRLGEPHIEGRQAILYTFSGEEGSNHVVAWPTDTGAVSLQLLGAAEPPELVELARQTVRSRSG